MHIVDLSGLADLENHLKSIELNERFKPIEFTYDTTTIDTFDPEIRKHDKRVILSLDNDHRLYEHLDFNTKSLLLISPVIGSSLRSLLLSYPIDFSHIKLVGLTSFTRKDQEIITEKKPIIHTLSHVFDVGLKSFSQALSDSRKKNKDLIISINISIANPHTGHMTGRELLQMIESISLAKEIKEIILFGFDKDNTEQHQLIARIISYFS